MTADCFAPARSDLPGGKAGDALFVSARSCAGSDSGPGRIDLISPFVKVGNDVYYYSYY